MSTALLLLPDFALILLGAALRRRMHLGDHFWLGLEKLVYFILFPALLVNAVMKTPINLSAAAPLLATALLAMAVAMLATLPLGRLFKLKPLVFASIFQCAYRFNSYIALAVIGMLHGTAGIAAMGLVLGVAVPAANLISVWMLARHGGSKVLRELAQNPLIWATLIGFLLNLAGVVPPQAVQLFLSRLADASIALGLLAVGAALRLDSQAGMRAASFYVLLVKLFVLPLAAALIGRWLGLSGLYFQVAVLFAALPTASSAYILTMRLGGDGRSVAWLVSATTLGAMLSLSLWATWLAQ